MSRRPRRRRDRCACPRAGPRRPGPAAAGRGPLEPDRHRRRTAPPSPPGWRSPSTTRPASWAAGCAAGSGVPEPLARGRVEEERAHLRRPGDAARGRPRSSGLYKAKIALRHARRRRPAARPGRPGRFLGARPPKFRERGPGPLGQAGDPDQQGPAGLAPAQRRQKGACWKESGGRDQQPGALRGHRQRRALPGLQAAPRVQAGPGRPHRACSCAAATRCSCATTPASRPSDRGTGAIHGLMAPLRNAAGSAERVADAWTSPWSAAGSRWCSTASKVHRQPGDRRPHRRGPRQRGGDPRPGHAAERTGAGRVPQHRGHARPLVMCLAPGG